jgi:hypothetical protein
MSCVIAPSRGLVRRWRPRSFFERHHSIFRVSREDAASGDGMPNKFSYVAVPTTEVWLDRRWRLKAGDGAGHLQLPCLMGNDHMRMLPSRIKPRW